MSEIIGALITTSIYAFDYAYDSAGGFVARIPGTNITSYAYPTSMAASAKGPRLGPFLLPLTH